MASSAQRTCPPRKSFQVWVKHAIIWWVVKHHVRACIANMWGLLPPHVQYSTWLTWEHAASVPVSIQAMSGKPLLVLWADYTQRCTSLLSGTLKLATTTSCLKLFVVKANITFWAIHKSGSTHMNAGYLSKVHATPELQHFQVSAQAETWKCCNRSEVCIKSEIMGCVEKYWCSLTPNW